MTTNYCLRSLRRRGNRLLNQSDHSKIYFCSHARMTTELRRRGNRLSNQPDHSKIYYCSHARITACGHYADEGTDSRTSLISRKYITAVMPEQTFVHNAIQCKFIVQ